jgi:predicted glycogen debranching enzyme
MKISFGQLDSLRHLEWLETNALGGFAASTVIGMNTRRYHGLLVAATKPPVGRCVLLSKLEETLLVNGESFELSVNQYPGAIHPTGYRFLVDFSPDPFPVFRYVAGGVELEKRLFLVHGENSVVVQYRQLAGPPCDLEIRPLIAFRDYHATTHRNDALNPAIEQSAQVLSIQPYRDLPRLYFAHNTWSVQRTGDWYNNFEYAVERERGLDDHEDLFQPFLLRFSLGVESPATVVASTNEHRTAAEASLLENAERRRRETVRSRTPIPTPFFERLTSAADQFLVQRGDFQTIIAGYPWFSDWGRDTMISLPGLTLATKRFDDARKILLAFAQYVSQGMLPNRFPDAGERPEYNTVDATLWFFEAARAYVAYSGDFDLILERLLPAFREILQWHLEGTRYGIRCGDDGLLTCGQPGVQLTWMDAKVGDWVVTPRIGKPVEIQALWFNAIVSMANFCRRAGDLDSAAVCETLAAKAKASFHMQFWTSDRSSLCDVVTLEGKQDESIRPNQIFAVSLHHPLVEGSAARSVVETVKRELLTPMGLRTLSSRDVAYKGRYQGGVHSRDSAYHQGTVWPWLMGPFVTAYCRTAIDRKAARGEARVWLEAFERHLDDSCFGQISEIADGDFPHAPRGCVAQAWSVAELLRCAVEDVFVVENGS